MKSLLLVIAALLLFLPSCSQPAKTRPKIGIAMRSFDDPASVSIRRAIETASLDRAELTIIDGKNQQSTQDMQVASFFEHKLGAIAVDPVEGNSLASLIGKAKAQQTPIVFFDRRPPDEAMRSWDKLFFVGTRESDAGTAQGELLAAYWKAEPLADRNRDGRLQYAVLEGQAEGPGGEQLGEDCERALGSAGIKAQRLELDAAGLAKNAGAIEALVCADPSSALSSIEALKALGFFKGKKSLPIVVSGSGQPSPAILQALASGSLLGAAYSDTNKQGQAVVELALALAKGLDPAKTGWRVSDAKYVWIPCRIYSRETSTQQTAKK